MDRTLNAYSIYDAAAGAFTRPFFMQTDQQAQRAFLDLVNTEGEMVNKHPEDYTLFKIGNFNELSGEFGDVHNLKLLTGLEAVIPKSKQPGQLDFVEETNGEG